MLQVPMEQADYDLQGRIRSFTDLLGEAEGWAKAYEKTGFAATTIRSLRRKADRTYRASQRRLCVGVFGPSGAGKSFLIGEMGRLGGSELLVACPMVQAGRVPFMENINPNRKDEATAVICRLSTRPPVSPERHGAFVARALTQADILKCVATGFTYECNFPNVDGLAAKLEEMLGKLPPGDGHDPFIEVLDDAWGYVQENFSYNAYFHTLLTKGDIRGRLQRIGGPLTAATCSALASTLWGMGDMPAIDVLYGHLVAALKQIDNATHFEVDWDAVVSLGGTSDEETGSRTVVDATVLDDIFQGKRFGMTAVYLGEGAKRKIEMSRASVSAIISELYLLVDSPDPSAASPLLDRADILDFPGARTGHAGDSGLDTGKLQDDDHGRKTVVSVFKRGKLTYLFEGYCREREVNVLVVCVDSAERPECHNLPVQVRRWLETRYARFDKLDGEEFSNPSLFLCLTKFDKMLDPGKGVGSEMRWDGAIERTVGFFSQGLHQPWFTNWGMVRDRPFDNVFWVRNPVFPIDQSVMAEHRSTYLASTLVQRYMKDSKTKWDSVVPASEKDATHTGVALAAEAVIRKLRPDVKRRELEDQLIVLGANLDELLRRYYVADEVMERMQDAKEAAKRFAGLIRKHESDCIFGPLLNSLGLPEQIVSRQLENITRGAVPVLTAQQVRTFVDQLIEEWRKYVQECLENEEGLEHLVKEEPAAVSRFVSELADRAKNAAVVESFCRSVRYFFEHPLGVSFFRHQVAAICFRRWSDFVTSFGYGVERPPEPSVPPKLCRDLPFRRYANHWYTHLEPLYAENSSSDVRIPAGNELLAKVLSSLKQI